MFVQRLPRWLRRLVASLFRRHPQDMLPPERTAVLSASLRGGAGADHAGISSGASWLDDGRRLRPRPSPPARLDQRWNGRPAIPRQPVPTQPQHGRMSSVRPASEQQAPESPRMQPAEPAARREEPVPVEHPERPGDISQTAFGSPSPAMAGQVEYRRLMALKRLVRLGIYSEGFDPNHVPSQYWHSLGREDDLPSE